MKLAELDAESMAAVLSRLYSERGYLVVHSWEAITVGTLLPGVKPNRTRTDLTVHQPFIVLTETDREDFLQQCREADLEDDIGPFWGGYFYRVVTE